jgi:hypothetical protein
MSKKAIKTEVLHNYERKNDLNWDATYLVEEARKQGLLYHPNVKSLKFCKVPRGSGVYSEKVYYHNYNTDYARFRYGAVNKDKDLKKIFNKERRLNNNKEVKSELEEYEG